MSARTSSLLVHGSAAFAIAVGLAVLAGWALDVPVLKTVLPGYVTMKVNTALGFLLAGASLVLLAPENAGPRRRFSGRLLASLVVAIGALTLGQEVFGRNLGIDELIMRDADALRVFTSAPGRMAVATTIAFILLGLALLVLDWTPRRGPAPAELLSIVVIAMSSVAAVAYVYGREALVFPNTRMAVHTFVTLYTLCAGVLAARPQRGLSGALRSRIASPLERNVYGAIALAALALFVSGAASFFAAADAVARSRIVERTHEARLVLLQMLSLHQDIETGQRGYLITGRKEFLAPYEAARSAVDSVSERLAGWMSADPAQEVGLAALEAARRQHLAWTASVLEARERDGKDAAERLVAAGEGRFMDRLRTIVARLDSNQDRILAMQSDEERLSVARLNLTLGASTLLALFVVFCAVVVIHRDFTRRQRAEAALRESEESLATTLRSIGDAVLATDTDGRVTRMNPVAERLTGWPLIEARGRPAGEVFRIVSEQTRAPAEVPVEKVLATGNVQGLANHTLLLARDGKEHPIADSAAPIRDVGGRVIGVVLVFRDATAERRAERLLQEQNELLEARVRERTAQLSVSEARLRTTVDHLGEGVVMADLDGQLLDMNPAAIEMHGFRSREEYLRRLPEFADTLELATPGGALVPLAEWPLARVLRGETLREVDLVVRRRDAVDRIISYGGTLVPGAEGKPVLAVLTCRDITERRRAEEEIRALNADLERRVAERTAQLEEANRAKSDFLANMSHELRTPLNSIIGFSEMLKDGVLGPLDERQRGFVGDIFASGTHLLSLINDILDLSKVEAGMMQLEMAPTELAALLEACTLVVREKALGHRIRLETRVESGLGTVLADERKVKQIVYNLLSNAVKFTADGGRVVLSARRCTRAEARLEAGRPGRALPLPADAPDDLLEIAVEDTGVGIPEESLAKLFEPFSQVDASVSRRFGGTGLGLSLVRRLAELNGGAVGVSSSATGGSRFCVWLPYLAAPAASAASAASTASAQPRHVGRLALVIEDDDVVAKQIESELKGDGFEVMRAATAEEGLVRAAKCKPALITLDIFLPAMDGWEFLSRLKADPLLADTPVVIITVSHNLQRGLVLGAQRVLQKPFAREELRAALAGVVAIRQGAIRVLVADDNAAAVELVATMLQAEGHVALRAYGGKEAIQAARRELPDLVILDLMMPEVSGFEVADELRKSETTAAIPILVLTAKELTREDHARLNRSVSAILEKSNFSGPVLLSELHRALDGMREGGG